MSSPLAYTDCMKALKIILVSFALIVLGGMVIGAVGAGTPLGNAATIGTIVVIFVVAKRLSAST